LKVNLFYLLESPDHDYRRAYSELFEQVLYAESLGFDTVWLAEHHGSDYGSVPSTATMAAALAQATSTIKLGCAVTNVTFRHPTHTAEEWAMVDNLSDGRVRFGAGRGYQPREFRAFGLEDSMSNTREMFWEAMDCIVGLWTNKRFSYDGQYYKIDDHELRPTLVQQPHPEIFVATASPEGFPLIAERGYNLLVNPSLTTMDQLTDLVVDAKRTLLQHGRPEASLNFPLSWFFHVADSEEEAAGRAGPFFQWYFDEAMKHVPQGAKVPKGYEVFAQMAEMAKQAGGLRLEDMLASEVMFIGTPERAIAKLTELHDLMGLHEFTSWQRVGGMKHEYVMDSIRLTGEKILPELEKLPPVLPRALREDPVVA
jgi:alkanesulfonate monooxygenase SsuD/methylene tetrahydromethanopterin reductase-like flavin-dependent oxidoreductase (luciferase family)